MKNFDYEQMMMSNPTKVLENDEAVMIYNERTDKYIAISKEIKGSEYSFSGLYQNSTEGDYKKCKRAFEKYSPKMMSRR